MDSELYQLYMQWLDTICQIELGGCTDELSERLLDIENKIEAANCKSAHDFAVKVVVTNPACEIEEDKLLLSLIRDANMILCDVPPAVIGNSEDLKAI